MDSYAWMRDKEDPRVMAFLEAENARAAAAMAHTAELQETLYTEMLGRIKETDSSVPAPRGPYLYYTRTEAGKSYAIHCRRRNTPDAPEEIILDVNVLADGHEYTSVTASAISPDHRLLAYAVDRTGYERPTLVIKDLETGEHLPDRIEPVGSWSLAWANDNRTLLYTGIDETNRPFQLKRHILGTEPSEDVLILEELDERFWVHVGRTLSGEYLLVSASSKVTSEEYLLSANAPHAPLRMIAPRRDNVEYNTDHHGDRLFILTNHQALNFKIVTAPVDAPDHWTDYIPHDPEVYLTGHELFAEHLVLTERRGGLQGIRIHRLKDRAEHGVSAPEPVSVTSTETNLEFNTQTLRLSYTSMVTPRSVVQYDMNTRERVVLKQDEVGNYDPSRYTCDRLWANAPDGQRVPISLVHLKSVPLDGTAPALLYAYGSYGYSMEPSFSSTRVSLLDRGIVFAIAHVRGGSEMGRQWYEDGKLMHKRNTFTDFIACAEALVAQKVVHPRRLLIRGGSAGGLLIGAVLNMRPDLFHAAHAAVPFVDCINTMLDASIPLTVTEYDEWGNPNEASVREYMTTYSPYDNVVAQDYPHLLITTGINDPRVAYWEPAKWAAKLQEHKTDDNALLLRTNLGAGHGGASGRYARLKEIAYEDAFLIDRVS